MALNLRQKQAECISRMLNLNQPVNATGTANEEVYKILIYDRFCHTVDPCFHLNFSSTIARSLLEDLASGTLNSDSIQRISKHDFRYHPLVDDVLGLKLIRLSVPGEKWRLRLIQCKKDVVEVNRRTGGADGAEFDGTEVNR
ncbi:hypothetical protein ACOSQ3_017971 [Xanthoceras sorbifolium]